jgi:hypothetical protein
MRLLRRVEEAFKCRVCEFAEGCTWRQKTDCEKSRLRRVERKEAFKCEFAESCTWRQSKVDEAVENRLEKVEVKESLLHVRPNNFDKAVEKSRPRGWISRRQVCGELYVAAEDGL